MSRIIKFIATGCVGITVNLTALFILADAIGIHYLTASVLAISISTVVGFLLQKYWTFQERSQGMAGKQFILYVLVTCMNILFNTLIVYTLVEKVGVYYLAAQFIGAGTVAVSSFIIYKKFIFRTVSPAGV